MGHESAFADAARRTLREAASTAAPSLPKPILPPFSRSPGELTPPRISPNVQTMFAGIFRLLVIALIIYIVYLAVKLWTGLGDSARRASRDRSRPPGGTMVKDEVCNTYVPKEEALRVVKDGREHFFCCPECRRKFLEGGAAAGADQSPKNEMRNSGNSPR